MLQYGYEEEFQSERKEDDIELNGKYHGTPYSNTHANNQASSTRNILIIDDNVKILKHLGLILKENGYNVQSTNLLDEGIQLLAKKDFDAVLLDVPIPKQKGLDTLYRLAQADVLKKQKIILLTAIDLEQSRIEELRKKGLHLVLKKPVHPDKILKQLAFLSTMSNSKLGMQLDMEKSKKVLEEKCNEMLSYPKIRFCGIINNMGNLTAGKFKEDLMPHEDDNKRRSMYMQLSLEIAMRKDHDETLGPVEYIASKRGKVLMVSIPVSDHIILISAEPDSNPENIATKASKLFGDIIKRQNEFKYTIKHYDKYMS